MDVLPLPPRPDLAQYRKRAKDLVTATQSTEPGAVRAWATDWVATIARLRGVPDSDFVRHSVERAAAAIETQIASRGGAIGLADAQFFIARAHGFERWADFANHVTGAVTDPFERAANAVVHGELEVLADLLRADPSLVRARSTRTHHVTLLHYVAANGVEDWRQLTPPNAVAIAGLLLARGAEVDAVADTYGGGSVQTTMNLLVSSTHPAEAGLQSALVEVLLDHGAAIDGLANDESPLLTALAFGYGEAAETLARRGARVDSVLTAAALGRIDLIDRYVMEGGTLRPSVPLIGPPWFRLAADPRVHVEQALVWAAQYGRHDVVRLMLDRGVNPASANSDHMTALHAAAGNADLAIVALLLRHGAPLEVKNDWGGTVLDSTVWFVRNTSRHEVREYLPVLEALIDAGADVRAVTPFPTGIVEVDELLRRHGAG